jgi:HPt (histidine-containing phosphotransfer) domain-containing protein
MPTIDLSYLRTFCDGDESFLDEMVQTFLEKLPDELGQLKDSVGKEDWHSAYKAAHNLKSSFPMIGLDSYREDILSMETSFKQAENLDHAKAIMKRIIAAGEVALQDLKNWQKAR